METALYALCLMLIVVIVLVRSREKKIQQGTHYLRAYFELMELPIGERALRLKQWEDKAYKQAFPELYKADAEQPQPENVVSIHKAI